MWQAALTFFGQYVCVHLNCNTSVAERQGRSSRVWSSSTAVPAVTREGSRSTKSSTTAGLSHAKNFRDKTHSPHQPTMIQCIPINRISEIQICKKKKSSLVFTLSRFGKERVYCGTRTCRLSRFIRRKRSSSCARKGSLNNSAGNRLNTSFHTHSQSTAAISPKQVQVHIQPFENSCF